MSVAAFERLVTAIGGRRVGLVTGPTGWVDEVGHLAMALAERGLLSALFAPEHGIWGDAQAGDHVADATDPRLGVPVHSLYGANRKPNAEQLADCDLLVGCLQDASSRPYTYILTLTSCLEACFEAGKPFLLLDRPTPLGGLVRQGNVGGGRFARVPVPMRIGLTHGEYLRLTIHELGWQGDLEVVPLSDAPRSAWYDETGLMWVLPSPNLPTLDSTLAFTATVLLEATNASEGRGTTKPFELLGMPGIDGWELAANLNARGLPGVVCRPAAFVPTFSKHQGKVCGGVQLHITDRHTFDGPRLGLHILEALRATGGDDFEIWPGSLRARFDDASLVDPLVTGSAAADDVWSTWPAGIAAFEDRCRAAGLTLTD